MNEGSFQGILFTRSVILNIEQKIETIQNKFSNFSNWEDKYRQLILLGKELPEMGEEHKNEKFRVKGCQSQVWVYPELKENHLFFQADSDALIVKGIVKLLVDVYSGETPEVIMNHKPDFLKELGISDHLSMNRTNGLASIVKSMKMYALAFNTLVKK